MHNTDINQIISNPVGEYDNLIEICASFIDAARDGNPGGKRASANKRFKVHALQSMGYDELGHFDAFDLAGVMFDRYECGVVKESYPLDSKLRTSLGYHTLGECVVWMVMQERLGEEFDLFEYAEKTLARLGMSNAA